MNKQIITGLLGLCGAFGAGAQATETGSAPAQLPMLMAHAGHDHGGAPHGHAPGATASGAVASGAAASEISKAKTSATLTVSGCWIRSMPSPAPSGGYFVIANSANESVHLKSAASPAYGMVMLHQTVHKDGMSRMSAAHSVVIPAGGQLEFKPGAYHAMLEDPIKDHPVGSKIALDFLFDNGEKASAECEIKPANTRTPMPH